MTMILFDKTIALLSKALDSMSLRHEIIAANIANQDTPNYRAKDLNFKEALESAMKTGGPEANVRTNPRHIELSDPESPASEGNIITRSAGGTGYDNNSVNIEFEMADMAKNTLMYNTSAQIIATKFRALSSAIREGR